MKKLFYKIILILLGSLFLIFSLSYLFYRSSLSGYREISPEFDSTLASSLAIFEYNQSQHDDPVPGCWYDSGDYIVVLPRNVETLFYLSLAYREAKSEVVKKDLKLLIDQQLSCVEGMLDENYKQFRDQDSHGVNVPPSFNQRLYPSDDHFFAEGEGGDVFLMLSLVHENLGDSQSADFYRQDAQERGLTSSDNCCELGPLVLMDEEWQAIQRLAAVRDDVVAEHIWGVQFPSLLALEQADYDSIEGLLSFLKKDWKGETWPFEYLGGNYDIAGTIALERLYAKVSGDDSYRQLSDQLYAYLQGDNPFDFNFTQADYLYHPCYFFKVCELEDTLINGIYEPGEKRIRHNWQNSEVQLVGQAQYVLMKVLYLEL